MVQHAAHSTRCRLRLTTFTSFTPRHSSPLVLPLTYITQGTFAPLSAPLLDMLHWAALNKSPKVQAEGGRYCLY